MEEEPLSQEEGGESPFFLCEQYPPAKEVSLLVRADVSVTGI
jgi:hypothetical protein